MKFDTLHRSVVARFFAVFLLFALPSSTNYEMHDFGFGSGGSSVSDSTNYSVVGISGEVSGQKGVGTTYNLGEGLIFTQQSNVPAVPTFTNVSSNYNKLKFVIDNGSNPTDTLFAIAISTDDFTTTNYIQSDDTIGASAVYQTYTNWGGATGEYVTGLAVNTTYKIKVKAIQTKYTETEFSVAASATTSSPTLTYDLDIAPTDSESAPPYIVAFGSLGVGSVTTASDKVWVDLDTNAEGGAFVYVYSSGTGLTSTEGSYTITSATADLSSVDEGYGAQVASVTQSSGGPLVAVSPYNSSSQNVGILNTTSRNIFTSSGAPITAGRGSVYLKAKASITTPAASDYADTITMIASSTF
jgi:hypothetical protein